jgi:immunity protein Imm1 of predicted polymorphic toxin system
MTTYVIEWGRDPKARGCHRQQITEVDELQRVLDDIHAASTPTVISLYAADDPDGPGLQIGLGHPTHAFALPIEAGGDYATDPAVPTLSDDVVYDYNGEPTEYEPDELRITPQHAMQLAHLYVAGARPRT